MSTVQIGGAAFAPRASAASRRTTGIERVPVVTFALGDDLFAMDVREVDRVIRLRELAPVPNMPEWMLGVLEYRGRIAPVLDLRARFELPAAPVSADRRTLICVVDGVYTGAVVDAVLDVRAIEVASIEPPPPLVRGLAREYVRGVFRRDDRLTILLHAARLLSATERLALIATSTDV